MTLITNEIHLINGSKNTFIVSTADRRLTFDEPVSKKAKYRSGQKLFKIEHLNATVSYWGNFYIADGSSYITYSEWLPRFINRSHDIKTLGDFTTELRNRLNRGIKVEHMKQRGSGFHLAGFSKVGIPEFFHFSNCKWNGVSYDSFENVYKAPFADFGQRDAVNLGANQQGEIPSHVKARIIYRNGELKVHHAAWDSVDKIMKGLLADSAFKSISKLQTDDLKRYIEFKLKFIGSIYKQFAFIKGVGTPFDVHILRPYPEMKIEDFSTIFMEPTEG